MKNIILEWLTVNTLPIEALSEGSYMGSPLVANAFMRSEYNNIIFSLATAEHLHEMIISPEILKLKPMHTIMSFLTKSLPGFKHPLKSQDAAGPFPETFRYTSVIVPESEVDLTNAFLSPATNNLYKYFDSGYTYVCTLHNGYAYIIAMPIADLVLNFDPDNISVITKAFYKFMSKQIDAITTQRHEPVAEPFARYENVLQLRKSG